MWCYNHWSPGGQSQATWVNITYPHLPTPSKFNPKVGCCIKKKKKNEIYSENFRTTLKFRNNLLLFLIRFLITNIYVSDGEDAASPYEIYRPHKGSYPL